MNEFDGINRNENDSQEAASNVNREESSNGFKSDNSAETENGGVVFNDDGTYHGKVHTEEEPPQRPYEPSGDARNNGRSTQYPYGEKSGQYSYNEPRRESPRREEPAQTPYEERRYPYSGTSYPYSNQQQPPRQNESMYGSYQDNQRYAYSDNQGNKKKKNGTKTFAAVISVLCVCLAVALIAVIFGDKTPSVAEDETTTTAVAENVEEFATSSSPETGSVNTSGEMTPKNIYNKVLPSSVGILVYDKSKTLSSEGSGVLFQESTDGKYTYIVTCAHVISDSSGYIRVQTHDGKEYDAEVVGFDARTDIGVIRIEKTGFTLADIGDSSKISVGDPIYAIGNPGGVEFANSFTDGIVSALDRPVNSSETGYTTECIQHTAAINPGNSGGALVNSFGQVIGINSMKIVADEYEGMGFAVPSSVFTGIVNEIMTHGYVSNRPKLGITYVAATEYSTYGMFVAIKGLPSGSIVIYEISSDSSFVGTEAEVGDMIVAVNGVGLDDASYLSEVIENSNVGDKLTLSLVRIHDDYSYDEFDVTVTLVEDRGDTFVTEEETTNSGSYPGGYEDYFEQYFEDYFGNYFGGGYNP